MLNIKKPAKEITKQKIKIGFSFIEVCGISLWNLGHLEVSQVNAQKQDKSDHVPNKKTATVFNTAGIHTSSHNVLLHQTHKHT